MAREGLLYLGIDAGEILILKFSLRVVVYAVLMRTGSGLCGPAVVCFCVSDDERSRCNS
jgi:hypothetical protein